MTLTAQPRTLRVALGDRSYDIQIGSGLLAQAAEPIGRVARGRKVLIAWDENVASPHGKILFHALSTAGFQVEAIAVPPGEASKSVEQLSALWDKLVSLRYGRDCLVVAVGGGVVGDLVGFAAASFLRGVDFVQVPTTLLAMVDSSVGGKTGINHPLGKNLLGAFWQPRLVLADLATLETLPRGERISALAEIIKYGVIRDADFFAWLEQNIARVRDLEPEALTHAVERSCAIKADVVGADERETGGIREILNFGHTVAHAIENSAGYGAIRHGEAVAIGMVAESLLGLGRSDRWTEKEHLRLIDLIAEAGLPTALPEGLLLSVDALLAAAKSDKKNKAGATRYMIPTRLGEVRIVSLEDEVVAPVLRELGAR